MSHESSRGAVTAAHHTSFTVTSLDRTLPFFLDVLGLPLLSRAPRDPSLIEHVTGVTGARVEIAYAGLPGGHAIELIEFTGPEGRDTVLPRPCDVGFAHLALVVRDIEDIIARAEAIGVRTVNSPVVNGGHGPIAGAKVAYLRNSDGVTIELIELRSV